MAKDGVATYASAEAEAMWENLWEISARAGLSRRVITKWLGCTPATLAKLQGDRAAMYERRIASLSQVLLRCLADGVLPADHELELLNSLVDIYKA